MKWIKRLCSFIFLCLFLVVAFMLWRGYGDCQDALKKMSVQQMGAQIQAKEDYTTLDQLPKDYIDAVLAVEDKRFYKHPGIDPLAICRALYNDIRAGSYVEGGSTITQQLARGTFLSNEKTLSRKIKEIFIAWELNKKYSKEQIMEFYCNSCCFANGIYGVEDASQKYFGRSVNDLSLSETAYLCAIPNRPEYYNPLRNSE